MGNTTCCEQNSGGPLPSTGPAGPFPLIDALPSSDQQASARTTSASLRSGDRHAFDLAMGSDPPNIPEFVRLMDSMEEFQPFNDRMHPWAADPKTIGALAGTQLAIISSQGCLFDPWGCQSQADRPNFSGLVLGCIDAGFCK